MHVHMTRASDAHHAWNQAQPGFYFVDFRQPVMACTVVNIAQRTGKIVRIARKRGMRAQASVLGILMVCHSVQPLDVRVGGPHCQRSMSRAKCHYVGIVSTHGIHASECGWLAWCDLVKSPPQH